MLEPMVLMIAVQFLILTGPAMIVGYWLWRQSKKEKRTVRDQPSMPAAKAPEEKRAA